VVIDEVLSMPVLRKALENSGVMRRVLTSGDGGKRRTEFAFRVKAGCLPSDARLALIGVRITKHDVEHDVVCCRWNGLDGNGMPLFEPSGSKNKSASKSSKNSSVSSGRSSVSSSAGRWGGRCSSSGRSMGMGGSTSTSYDAKLAQDWRVTGAVNRDGTRPVEPTSSLAYQIVVEGLNAVYLPEEYHLTQRTCDDWGLDFDGETGMVHILDPETDDERSEFPKRFTKMGRSVGGARSVGSKSKSLSRSPASSRASSRGSGGNKARTSKDKQAMMAQMLRMMESMMN
jgi:hypothetical protein